MSSNDYNDDTEPTVEGAPGTPQTALKEDTQKSIDERSRIGTERSSRTTYRRLAVGLGVLGGIAAVGGVIFAGYREMLFAFAAVGLFGGVLAHAFTNDRFVSAKIPEHISSTASVNESVVADELGFRGDRVYVPNGKSPPVTLVIPEDQQHDPSVDRTLGVRVEGDARELVLEPLGSGLLRELTEFLVADLASKPDLLAVQLTEGLVEHFELVRDATTTIDPDGGHATIGITDSALGPVDQFDHPIPSFLAVGFATGLDRPVTLDITRGDEPEEWLITCTWDDETTT